MKRNRLLRLVVPISLILALVLAMPMLSGCFPKAAEPAAPAPEPAAPAPEPEAPPEEVEPIKVGVPLPMTGWYVADGLAYFQGISMAIDEINAEGGLLGRPLKIIRFDHQNYEPEIVMEGADYLVGAKKVEVVHAGWAGYGGDVKAYGKYDVPYFHVNASISTIEVFRSDPNLYWNSFQMNDIEAPYGRWGFDIHMMLPYEYPNNKIAIIAGDEPWARASVVELKEAVEEEGWEVVMDEVVPYGTTEWGPLLTKIRALDPAIIGVEIFSVPEQVTFFRQFMEEPTNSLIYFSYGGVLPGVVEMLGEEGDGITMFLAQTGCALPVAQTPAAQEWADRYKLKFGVVPGASASTVYDGVMVWANAVRQVGDVTDYRAISQYIADVPFEAPNGVGVMDFDEDNKLLLTPDWPAIYMQIQGGKLVALYIGEEKYVDYQGTAYEFQVPPWIE